MRQEKAFPLGLHERPRQVFPVGKSQAVDYRREGAAERGQAFAHSVDFLILGDVAGQHRYHVQILAERFQRGFLMFSQVAQHQIGALPGERLGHREGEAPLVGDAQDQAQLSF